MNSAVNHTLIRASAGSGKTHQLAHRYLRLLSEGVEPDRILAITFSRKAAGEIFQSVVSNLLRAASSTSAAQRTAAGMGRLDWGQEDFLNLVPWFFDRLHRVRISTLDSFYVTLLKLFALELGMSPQCRLVDTSGEALLRLRIRVLNELNLPTREQGTLLQELEEAFKLATFGKEDLRFQAQFLGFLEDYERYFRINPDPAAWGDRTRIWQEAPAYAWPENMPELASRLRRQLEQQPLKAYPARWLRDLADLAARHRPGDPLTDKQIERFVSVLFIQDEDSFFLGEGRNQVELNGELLSTLQSILSGVVCGELDRVVDSSRGLHRILSLYQARYMDQVRGRGLLAFNDVLEVLAPQKDSDFAGFTGQPDNVDRLLINYRLDGRIDHWLLDEFQDTSSPQYRVIEDLLDEVIQHPEGNRTVFIVGDVKQSIYGWRGGEFGLMDRILERYGKAFDEHPMNQSWRSCPAVLEMVNRAFQDVHFDRPEMAAAEAEWNLLWGQHQSAGPLQDVSGYAALIQPSVLEEKKTNPEQLQNVTADLLEQLQPWTRGLSCAVLAFSNKDLTALAPVLRQRFPGIPIRLQGRTRPAEEPLFMTLVTLIHWLQHPGDTAAEQVLRMSPLSARLPREGRARGVVHAEWNRALNEKGLTDFLREVGRDLIDGFEDPETAQACWLNLLNLAERFEEDPNGRLDEFVAEARVVEQNETSEGGGVQLMTVHASKGLGFDVVLLLLDSSHAMDTARGGLLIQRPLGMNEFDWMLKAPVKSLVEAEPVLKAADASGRSAECFEQLCKLYVALTRAKRGLYVIRSFSGKTSTSLKSQNFLANKLTGELNPSTGAAMDGLSDACLLWETGERSWYQAVDADRSVSVPPPLRKPIELLGRASARPSPARRSPSVLSGEKEPAVQLLRASVEEAFEFGTAFHALMERLQWMEDSPESFFKAWKSRRAGPQPLDEQVIAEARSALHSSSFAARLKKSEGDVELWREAPFEIMLEREWVSGVFDRVHVFRDAQGRAQRAEILDYKTNVLTPERDEAYWIEHYRPQMDLYRSVLAHMLRLPSERIERLLLFSKSGRACIL